MLTTQIQVLLYVGNIQLISCSVFVPVPSIVVKSHQTLEAILPYLPLSLTSLDPEENNSGPDPLLPQSALPAPPVVESHSSNTSAALSSIAHSSHSTSIILSTRQDIIPSSSSPSSRNNSSNSNTRRSSSNSNRISPDSSIPATTCIKISLQPTPSFKFVKPKCPHQHQKNRNRRHVQQEQQQQHHPSHSHSHSHHHGHNHSHNHSHQHRSDTHRHNHNHNHSNNSATNMASLEYPQQTSATATATAAAAVGGTITIKFTYPVPSTDSSSPTTIPEQVQVTGTFNSWQRSQPLTCNQDRTFFEADIPIDLASLPQEADNDKKKAQEEDGNQQKILFKFVLDGQSWVTDPNQPTERDYAGNLNNVLFINNPLASTSATTAPTTPKDEGDVKIKAEAEEEKAARLKQEAEDDETIRQLGGGMWGAPFFSVNDPIALPEHFGTADNETSQTKEAEVASAVAVTSVAAPVAAAAAAASKEEEKDVESAVAAVAQDIVAKRVEVDLPAVQDTQSVTVAESSSSSLTPENPNKVETKPKEEEVEDEDDKIIKALGGGMWGTPFFKVNDPAELPEHFLEALKHKAAAATVSTLPSSSTAVANAVETETEKEEEEITTDKDGSSTGEHHSHVQIVKDEIKATVEGGSLIETVVETTEDTVITAVDGTFLEESITTTVEDTISGVLEEEVTEVIETIEEEEAAPSAAAAAGQVVVEDEGVVEFVETIEEQTDDANDNRISAGVVTPSEVTMTETETTTAVQGEDGVETIVVEDTLTFTDGLEVDTSSLHSLTTATKPVGEGESVVVEQAPEVVVAATSASGSGDAKPSVDESVETPLPSLSSTTVNTAATPASESAEVVEPSTPVPGRVQQPLQDVVVLLPQDITTTVAGDAKPTADLSVATTVLTPLVEVKSALPAHLAPDAAPAALTLTTVAPTTTEKGEKTEKSEKRKSFWKKVKKVLS